MATISDTSNSTQDQEDQDETHQRKWSQIEKSIALEGLKLHGLTNMKNISEMVATKTDVEVRRFLTTQLKEVQSRNKFLNRRAYQYIRRRDTKLECLQVKKQSGKPLAKRERMALQIHNIKSCMLKSQKEELDPLPEALSRALLFISKFENHPRPSECNDVDFCSAYMFLSKLVTCSYVASKTALTTHPTAYYLQRCFQKLIDMVPDD